MLNPGTALGPYEIVAPLGAGGMGEVYRARDTRLGRDVAIKVLPEELTSSPEVRGRFEREARTISRLNHPHVCTLYDVGHQEGVDYLVMELLEGETLARRLEKGALPVAQVLELGAQIADALDTAHRAGLVHRDLKPANIMLTAGGAKLMDFGLARVAGPVVAGEGLPESPTVSRPLTAQGTLVGTFQYMAPEQLEGREADNRADLWALGCLLFEMTTGRAAFAETSPASLIAAIMDREPPALTELRPLSPPALEHVVRRCLAKDPGERWQSARDVLHELRWIAEAGSQAGVPVPIAARRRGRERVAWVVAAAAVAAVAGLGWILLRSRTERETAILAAVDAPPEAELSWYRADVAISPDGQAIAFVARDATGAPWLWLRPLASVVARQIPETRRASCPFWSPDSRYIAFFDPEEGKLKKVAVAGGTPTSICEARQGRGGSWSRNGVIVFAPSTEGPLMRVASGGGAPEAVTTLDSARRETGHRLPFFLPDGEHFLFAALPAGPRGWEACVGSLRSTEVKRILTADSAPVYAEPGYLVFERDRRVMAQRFDARRLALEGEALAIADAPGLTGMDADPVASASHNGRLALLRSPPQNARVALIDRGGATQTNYHLPPGPWWVRRVSPDGRQAAVANEIDLWLVDLARAVPLRFAVIAPGIQAVAWSPDGSRIAYVAQHAGREEVFIADLDGRAEPVPSTDDAFKAVWDWSRDGKYLVFGGLNAATNWDIWLLPLAGDRQPVPYARGPWVEMNARISPDGRWLAYTSLETGRPEIYVQPFQQPGRKVRVSPDGGDYPAWTRAGRELIYSGGAATQYGSYGPIVVSVAVQAGEGFRPGSPHPLLTLPAGVTGMDVVADGERFLVSVATSTRPGDIRLVLNWQALLKP